MRSKLKKLVSIAIGIYIVICSALYLIQDNLLFFPQELSEAARAVSNENANYIEDIELEMKDGTKIRGWFVKNSKSDKTNLLIYFGGNAEEVSWNISKVRRFQQWSTVLINYRGYGASDGKTSEKAMFSDALEIYDYLTDREDINKDNIVVWGRSIGTGVAAYLAAERNVSSVILTSPYDSLVSLVQEKFPAIPVNFILKYRFDSISRAPFIKSPLLVLVGTEDTTIPNWHSKKLADKWGGKATIEDIVGVGHNSISRVDEYWNIINDFLTKVDSTEK